MNGIIVVNKPKDYTSRDIVNIIEKKFNTKKVGHTGTLDPLATGVLVLCLGNHLKVAELLTSNSKEYIAKVVLGIETDTLDITGTIIKEEFNNNYTKEEIETALSSFIGKINQQVPKYSAVKVNGKKLYEYARNNIEVELPVKPIEIYSLELIDIPSLVDNHLEFTIKCQVSKGTYIRSLVRDIGKKLNTIATMKELTRTKQGKFTIEDSSTIEDILKDKYQILNMQNVLDIPKIIVDDQQEPKIKNGQILPRFFDDDKALILNKNNDILGIYQTYEKDNTKVKPWKIF
jgi:tRNA pseudouridine55 synthase